jgi:hypothetical protein
VKIGKVIPVGHIPPLGAENPAHPYDETGIPEITTID